MDILWMLMATNWEREADGSLNVYGIFRRVLLGKNGGTLSANVLAQVHMRPDDAGTNPKMALTVSHSDGRPVLRIEERLPILDMVTLLRTDRVVEFRVKVLLTEQEDYRLALSVDDETKAVDWLEVVKHSA